jgi:hypothetical protein
MYYKKQSNGCCYRFLGLLPNHHANKPGTDGNANSDAFGYTGTHSYTDAPSALLFFWGVFSGDGCSREEYYGIIDFFRRSA